MIIVPYFSYPGKDEEILVTFILPPSGCVPVKVPYITPHVGHTGLRAKAFFRQFLQNAHLHCRVSFSAVIIGSIQIGQDSSSGPLVRLLGVSARPLFLGLLLELCIFCKRNSFNLAMCTKDPVTVTSYLLWLDLKRSCGNLVCSSLWSCGLTGTDAT